MARKMKLLILFFAKYLCLFSLSKKMTGKKLRILCYHGFSGHDEAEFRPKLFMTPKTFSDRMERLHLTRFPVLSLDEAVTGLKDNTLPDCATVITIDDGWAGTWRDAMPVLRHYHFPATVYVTTYYVEKKQPVLNLFIQYLLWKTEKTDIDLASVNQHLNGHSSVRSGQEREALAEKLNSFIEHNLTADQRPGFICRLAGVLEVDVDELDKRNVFRLVTHTQIRDMVANGLDIQLHTHRHYFPQDDKAAAHREITDNQAVLKALSGKELTHFCYPSGRYVKHQPNWLQEWGIKSATTTNPGLNDSSTSPYELNRFCDGENLHMLEFEAELYGFLDVMRSCRQKISGWVGA